MLLLLGYIRNGAITSPARAAYRVVEYIAMEGIQSRDGVLVDVGRGEEAVSAPDV